MLMLSASPLLGSLGIAGLALLACVALLVVIRAQRSESETRSDHMEDLTFRLRHPWQWRAAHPVQAMKRRIVR